MIHISFRCLLWTVLFLCFDTHSGQSQSAVRATNKGKDKVETCRSNPKHTYQVFVPTVEKSGMRFPLLVLIDPHGNGKLAVSGFKEAALKYQVMAVGSNLVQNNDPSFMREIEELIADVKSRYQTGSEVYLGGFSGGARMAIDFASVHKVNGVIACGALAGAEQISHLNCRIVSVIGMSDFNFMETVPFILDPFQMPSNLLVELTGSSHSWSDKKFLQLAAGYLLLADNQDNLEDNPQRIKEFVNAQKHRIDSLIKVNDMIQAVMTALNMAKIETLEKEGSFRAFAEKLMQDKNYKLQVDKLSKCIQFETKIREAYFDALTNKDSVWWGREINALNTEIKSGKDNMNRMMYQRIKSFLGIVCYSLCQRFAAAQNADKLKQTLAVYRIVEPDNPEIIKFAGILVHMNGSRK
jgi:hypothetical protein